MVSRRRRDRGDKDQIKCYELKKRLAFSRNSLKGKKKAEVKFLISSVFSKWMPFIIWLYIILLHHCAPFFLKFILNWTMSEYIHSVLQSIPLRRSLPKKANLHCPYRLAGISTPRRPLCFSADVKVSTLILAEFDSSQPGGLKALNQSLLCTCSVSKCWRANFERVFGNIKHTQRFNSKRNIINRHNQLPFADMALTQPLAVYWFLCHVKTLAMQMLQAGMSRGAADSKIL